MFKYTCWLALVSAAFAASIEDVESTTQKRVVVPVLSYEQENSPDGSFKFSYESGDQTFREETAHIVDAGTEDEALEISGSYRYIDDEGHTVEVHYTAGRNGFVPVGTHILTEISTAAKAAADLPQVIEEDIKRDGHSNRKEKVKKVVEPNLEKHHKVVEEHQQDEIKIEELEVPVLVADAEATAEIV